MKINEKIMKLRKEKAWTQEEFAEKLNVSRQTVSKWELGQTIPDTENLTKIASVLGTTISDLLDENEISTENKTTKTTKTTKTDISNHKPILIIVLIIVLILVIMGIGLITINKVFNTVTNQVVPKSISEMFEEYSFGEVFDIIFGRMQVAEKVFENGKQNMENAKNNLENAKNEYKNAEIEFQKEKERVESLVDEIAAKEFSNNETNELSKFKVSAFNQIFKSNYYGTTNGFFMTGFIDAVIKSNEENPDHIITVTYNGTETNDAGELRNMKKEFSSKKDYEIIYEYDENGLVKKAIVEE